MNILLIYLHQFGHIAIIVENHDVGYESVPRQIFSNSIFVNKIAMLSISRIEEAFLLEKFALDC
jgi:hypothetical protein